MLAAHSDANRHALSRRSFFYRSVLAAGGVGALAGNAGFTQVAAAAQDATPASASSTVDPVQTTVPQVFTDDDFEFQFLIALGQTYERAADVAGGERRYAAGRFAKELVHGLDPSTLVEGAGSRAGAVMAHHGGGGGRSP